MFLISFFPNLGYVGRSSLCIIYEENRLMFPRNECCKVIKKKCKVAQIRRMIEDKKMQSFTFC